MILDSGFHSILSSFIASVGGTASGERTEKTISALSQAICISGWSLHD